MATKTLGTSTTSGLNPALQFYHTDAFADLAAVAAAIKNDTGAHNVMPPAISRNGLLFIPRRGVLQIRNGDWIGVDNQGWPILVSNNSVTNGNWTNS